MKRKINTKFYTYNQNNSGGSFVKSKESGICEYVCIEAIDSDGANNKAEDIGLYFNGCDDGMDCPCCGDRWYRCSESDGEDTPSLYGKPLEENEKSWFRERAFVHYMDGTFKEVPFAEKAST